MLKSVGSSRATDHDEEQLMKLKYYPETDSLYIEFKAEPGAETLEVNDSVNIDINANGEIVGLDIDHASTRLDLSEVEIKGIPALTEAG